MTLEATNPTRTPFTCVAKYNFFFVNIWKLSWQAQQAIESHRGSCARKCLNGHTTCGFATASYSVRI